MFQDYQDFMAQYPTIGWILTFAALAFIVFMVVMTIAIRNKNKLIKIEKDEQDRIQKTLMKSKYGSNSY